MKKLAGLVLLIESFVAGLRPLSFSSTFLSTHCRIIYPSSRLLQKNKERFSSLLIMSAEQEQNSQHQQQQQDETIGQMTGGLIFLKTRDRPSLVQFYMQTIQMKVWLEQPDISILSHGNFLIGLHHKPEEEPDVSGMYTFVYPSKQQVDEMYAKFQDTNTVDGPPRINERYRIYQFFAKDPEGRQLEFQAFLHPLSTVTSQV